MPENKTVPIRREETPPTRPPKEEYPLTDLIQDIGHNSAEQAARWLRGDTPSLPNRNPKID